MNPDLKKRIPAAIIYVLAIVGCTLGGTKSSMVLMIFLWALCQYEFVLHSVGKKWIHQLAYMILAIVATVAVLTGLIPESWWIFIILVSLALNTVNGTFLLLKGRNAFVRIPFFIQLTWYLVLPFGIALYLLSAYEGFPLILLGLFILIWLNDAGAYFIGKAMGKNKLFPQVSPSKTWEGFLGGGFFTLIAGIAFNLSTGIYSLTIWIGIALLIFVYSVVGDLVESAWKRSLGIKDTGASLPGHGGFLDRLDSFIYCVPVMALIVKLIGT